MALIQYGSVVANIAGSIGGATFARNRYGAYARNRTKPVDPGSEKQNTFRTRVSNAVAAWQALEPAQRDDFNAKAKTTDLVNRIGQTFHPSGINLFIRTFNLLDIASLEQQTTPPISPICQDPKSALYYDTGFSMQYRCDHTLLESGCIVLVWWEKNLTNSTYFYKGPYSHFKDFSDTGLADDKRDLILDAELDADSAFFAMVRVVNADGAASHPRRMRAFKPPAA